MLTLIKLHPHSLMYCGHVHWLTHRVRRHVLRRAGAEALVRHLVRHGVPVALATSSHRRHYDLKTQQHRELFSLFSPTVTGEDPM